MFFFFLLLVFQIIISFIEYVFSWKNKYWLMYAYWYYYSLYFFILIIAWSHYIFVLGNNDDVFECVTLYSVHFSEIGTTIYMWLGVKKKRIHQLYTLFFRLFKCCWFYFLIFEIYFIILNQQLFRFIEMVIGKMFIYGVVSCCLKWCAYSCLS